VVPAAFHHAEPERPMKNYNPHYAIGFLGQTCKSRAATLKSVLTRLEEIEKRLRPDSYSALELASMINAWPTLATLDSLAGLPTDEN